MQKARESGLFYCLVAHCGTWPPRITITRDSKPRGFAYTLQMRAGAFCAHGIF